MQGLPASAVRDIAFALGLNVARVFSVASFYSEVHQTQFEGPAFYFAREFPLSFS